MAARWAAETPDQAALPSKVQTVKPKVTQGSKFVKLPKKKRG